MTPRQNAGTNTASNISYMRHQAAEASSFVPLLHQSAFIVCQFSEAAVEAAQNQLENTHAQSVQWRESHHISVPQRYSHPGKLRKEAWLFPEVSQRKNIRQPRFAHPGSSNFGCCVNFLVGLSTDGDCERHRE